VLIACRLPSARVHFRESAAGAVYLAFGNVFDGYNPRLNKLNQFEGNFVQAEMVKAFITSIENRQRFGQP
jgi:hypothetical protein